MIGVGTQDSLVKKVNAQSRSLCNFRMITYNVSNEMHSEELERLVFAPPAMPCPCLSTLCSEAYGIIGLHCCGDLSASMCRLFVEAGYSCRLLSFVGCCYNLLSTRDTTREGAVGFPLNPLEVTVRMTRNVRSGIVQVAEMVLSDIEHVFL